MTLEAKKLDPIMKERPNIQENDTLSKRPQFWYLQANTRIVENLSSVENWAFISLPKPAVHGGMWCAASSEMIDEIKDIFDAWAFSFTWIFLAGMSKNRSFIHDMIV